VQHDPDVVALVQAQLDEVVAAAKRAEVTQLDAATDARVLRDDGRVARR